MFGLFKSQRDKIFDQIYLTEQKIHGEIRPLLNTPPDPIKAILATTVMATNIGMYFVSVKNNTVFEKHVMPVIEQVSSVFGSVLETATDGQINIADAVSMLLEELKNTQEAYYTALEKSGRNPESALQDCFDVFLKSGNLTFKDEFGRALAVILLSNEIVRLMKEFRSILRR